ncbi:NAD-dependent SIR2 family protein deacetylase [Panacagrimonas perspica]|uniref:NAD-dependent protein deacetylase n=1 Tax=Panacagrimonas perspica TaxID=381431 RepID=A0A4S3KB76_9GAMM|nr:NAD-dependent SIR2 family protein deacetylase [Panacagrimonas perspica]THD05569.1 NAD-dependent deacetylase [Panacagrimonas perspica]
MDAVTALQDFLERHPRLFVLTGAGCSTGSGIPDYRDDAGEWKRKPPVRHQEFVGDGKVRARYWARSMVGWTHMRNAQPNAAHRALAAIERQGRLQTLLTQNVDGLHQKAGSRAVIDLHGRIAQVVCLACAERSEREHFQQRLLALNPQYADLAGAHAPDGDADLERSDFSDFVVPGCEACDVGVLKPDVVFFGANVPPGRVTQSMEALDAADALLIVGSSLMVWSGYRFAARAAERGLPIAAINRGRTRADSLLGLKVEADCAEILGRLPGPDGDVESSRVASCS